MTQAYTSPGRTADPVQLGQAMCFIACLQSVQRQGQLNASMSVQHTAWNKVFSKIWLVLIGR